MAKSLCILVCGWFFYERERILAFGILNSYLGC